MLRIKRCLALAGMVCASAIMCPTDVLAQFPVVMAPAQPAVIGYTAERAGLFGQRIVFRPVFAPVSVASPVMVAPTVSMARPVWTETVFAQPTSTQPVVVGFAPPMSTVAPVTSFFAPTTTVTPVTSFFAPPVTTFVPAAPMNSFRVPVQTVVPVFGP